MTTKNHEFIHNYLTTYKNELTANKLHLEHQSSLPNWHRVTPLEPIELEQALENVTLELRQCESALEEFANLTLELKPKEDESRPY